MFFMKTAFFPIPRGYSNLVSNSKQIISLASKKRKHINI